jgi:hypothetical protein
MAVSGFGDPAGGDGPVDPIALLINSRATGPSSMSDETTMCRDSH